MFKIVVTIVIITIVNVHVTAAKLKLSIVEHNLIITSKNSDVINVTDEICLRHQRSLKQDADRLMFDEHNTTQIQAQNSSVQEECIGDPQFCNLTKEDYLQMLNAYIYPQTYEWVLIGTHTVVFVIGLLGNALVCVAVYRNHTMRTVTNYFLVNLAVADIMVLLFCLPATVLWDVTETWFLGDVLCKILLYFQSVSVMVSVLTLAFISVDRWYAICFPLKFKSTINRAKTAILVIWAVSLVFNTPELVVLTTVKMVPLRFELQYLIQCMPTWSSNSDLVWHIIKILFIYTIPLLLMTVAYHQIVRVLWSSQKIPGLAETIKLASAEQNTNKPEEHSIVTDSEIFPYMVAILSKFKYISAGALIDDSWVLTGADSLFMIRESSRNIRVRLGSVNYKEGGFLTAIKFFEIHPYFDDNKPLFDVALIKLPEPVRLNPHLNPIKLQNKYRKVFPPHFTVTAWPRPWGTGHQKSMAEIKRRRLLTVSHLKPLDREKCSEEMDMLIPDHGNKHVVMCLLPAIRSNRCQRDIGAPVVLNGILWGIISSWKSEDCDVDGEPIFLTLVSAKEVSSWIHSTVHGHRWTTKHTVDYDDNFI